MKACFNEATSMKEDLFTDVVSISQAGFRYMEVWKTKLYTALQKANISRIRRFFEQCGIEPVSINSLEDATFPENREEKFRECEKMCELAREIGANTLIVVPSFLNISLSDEQIVEKSVQILKEIAYIAAQWSVNVGFEFLGFRNCSVNNLSLAWQIVQEVSTENVGLVIDTFHFFVGDSSFEQLKRVPVEKILIVHINDLPEITDREPCDEDRIMPGDGVLPLKDFFSVLKEIGYSGPVSIELFNAEYWKWEPSKLASYSYEKLSKFINN